MQGATVDPKNTCWGALELTVVISTCVEVSNKRIQGHSGRWHTEMSCSDIES